MNRKRIHKTGFPAVLTVLLALAALFLTATVSLTAAAPLTAQAAPDTASSAGSHRKVYDYADLLSNEEEQTLEALCSKYGKKGKADLVLVTTNEPNGKDCEVFLEDMYDEIGFGYDKEFGDTVMIIIDMQTREVCIEGYGLAETRVNQSRGDYIRRKITPDLSAGNYFSAFADFTKLAAKCMRLKGGINPGNPLLLLPVQLILSLIVGAISVGSMAYHSKGHVTTNNQTYLDRANSETLVHRDDFVRTHTTRTKRPESSSGGSGGSSGGGGVSSGGHSHSTSRGSF